MNELRHPVPEVAGMSATQLDARIAALGVRCFESVDAAGDRQKRMLHRAGGDVHFRDIVACNCRHGPNHWRDCSAACHFATRLFRAELLLSEPAIFAGHDHPAAFFTVVPSRWRVSASALEKLDPRRLAAQITRALRDMEAPGLRASFDIETSFCEEGGVRYWAPHVHGLINAASLRNIRAALGPLIADDLNRRPLKLRCVPPSEIAVILNYASKRVDTLKVRYFTADDRPRWRKLPLPRREQVALDAWRCGFPVGFTHTRVGFKRNGAFLVPTS